MENSSLLQLALHTGRIRRWPRPVFFAGLAIFQNLALATVVALWVAVHVVDPCVARPLRSLAFHARGFVGQAGATPLRLARLGPRHAPRFELHAFRLQDCSTWELIGALNSLGLPIEGGVKRDALLETIVGLDIPEEVLLDALEDADRKRRQGRGRSQFPFGDRDLLRVLNILGLGLPRNGGWSRPRIDRALLDLGITAVDVEEMLKTVPGSARSEYSERPSQQRQRQQQPGPGPGREPRPRGRVVSPGGVPPNSEAEHVFYEGGGGSGRRHRRPDDEPGPGAGGGRDARARGRGGRRKQQHLIEEDDEDGWQRRDVGSSQFRPRSRDGDDYFEFHLDAEPWNEGQHWRTRQVHRASASASASPADEPKGYRSTAPSWAWPDAPPSRQRTAAAKTAAAPAKPVDPGAVMSEALRSGWSFDRLTNAQAARLLGLAPLSSPTPDVVRAARKAL
eukprot:CAMPEP_0203923030 /NCGR_PEP_ID=MMETSP0359-20131031/62984_1 /ASSEMBLY_ACC=CAM_ASM_000338 /TAXON_ID=268821 /ORGANISM="Scrippsiella Hangoei, Strain SHTV-5" /LENGTH=450 /DNA_ID=CAMNT_0050851039 /DNA_START=41 /DNA_END=1389 /DNA_ORIENTATION=-